MNPVETNLESRLCVDNIPADFRCRSCGGKELHPVLDLGCTPLANRLLESSELDQNEPSYPLNTVFCKQCSLVQITETVDPEILFRDYMYFSSFSDALLAHAKEMAQAVLNEKRLDKESLVVEAASNDGYLLKNFVEREIPVLGVEPASNIAEVARENGIPTDNEFFGTDYARKFLDSGKKADVFFGNNVLAHVSDLNGFVKGIEMILAEDGIVSIEAPYLLDLIEHCEFDTIYHEHLCYFSITALDQLFQRHGLTIYDLFRVPIHGGSLRIWAGKTGQVERRESVDKLLAKEAELGMRGLDFYSSFANKVDRLKTKLRETIAGLRSSGKRIAAYGASAKGSTLLNYFEIGADEIEFIADRSTVKQGHYTPGTHIPIVGVEALLEQMPDYVLLLTWNFRDEILRQQQEYLNRGGKFIVPIPDVEIVQAENE